MPLGWMDVNPVSFNALLLLETSQLEWFPGWDFPEVELAIALGGNPTVAWFLRHKAPRIAGWVDRVLAQPAAEGIYSPAQVRAAEIAVLATLEDLLVYALDPAIYDRQPFLGWDSAELTGLVDFTGKTVIDVGAGTGRQSFVAATRASAVFAVEPVGNLRRYLREKARLLGHANVYPVDGLIRAIPFPAGFAGVVMTGHTYGDAPDAEIAELERVATPGGMVILIPGNSDLDNDAHRCLVARGYEWSRFVEPGDGTKRKYWKRI